MSTRKFTQQLKEMIYASHDSDLLYKFESYVIHHEDITKRQKQLIIMRLVEKQSFEYISNKFNCACSTARTSFIKGFAIVVDEVMLYLEKECI